LGFSAKPHNAIDDFNLMNSVLLTSKQVAKSALI